MSIEVKKLFCQECGRSLVAADPGMILNETEAECGCLTRETRILPGGGLLRASKCGFNQMAGKDAVVLLAPVPHQLDVINDSLDIGKVNHFLSRQAASSPRTLRGISRKSAVRFP